MGMWKTGNDTTQSGKGKGGIVDLNRVIREEKEKEISNPD
jgi:hypothetical protein